ncbi:MAG: phosphopentomutase [Collinsella intestinalis]
MIEAGANRLGVSASIAILSELGAKHRTCTVARAPQSRARAFAFSGTFHGISKYRRILTIVIDSIGVGDAPDADKYKSNGADTLGHKAQWWVDNQGRPLALPNMERLGLGRVRPGKPFAGVSADTEPAGGFGRMRIISLGNDSLDGHWEMMCLPTRFEVDYFPQGFPDELLDKLRAFSGRNIVCNKPYSGTEVLKDYGEHQLATGDLIVYTSGDSVLQIAAHEDVIPLEELYRICEYARTLINGPEITMGRVIARPYVGTCAADFTRTANRHDYGLTPTGPTVVDFLRDAGLDTIAVGKTYDLLCGNGFSESYHNESNSNGMDHVDEVMARDWHGLCFPTWSISTPCTGTAVTRSATAWRSRTSTGASAASWTLCATTTC